MHGAIIHSNVSAFVSLYEAGVMNEEQDLFKIRKSMLFLVYFIF